MSVKANDLPLPSNTRTRARTHTSTREWRRLCRHTLVCLPGQAVHAAQRLSSVRNKGEGTMAPPSETAVQAVSKGNETQNGD
jgi:hypothetical protein